MRVIDDFVGGVLIADQHRGCRGEAGADERDGVAAGQWTRSRAHPEDLKGRAAATAAA